MTATFAIDDCGPFPLLTPGSVAELCDIVRQAAAANASVRLAAQARLNASGRELT